MILRGKRNLSGLRLQIVCALLSEVASLEEGESETLRSTFVNAAKGLKCTVTSCRCGDRWLEAMLDAEPGFDLPKAMTNLKAVTSRQVRGLRGGPAGIWAAGYVAVSIGEAVDPARAAIDLVSLNSARELKG